MTGDAYAPDEPMPIRYQEGYKYQLAEPYELDLSAYGFRPIIHAEVGNAWVSIDASSVLRIAATYAWDGDSGPARDTRASLRGSLVHDALYQLIRIGALRVTQKHLADRVYRDILSEDGMWSGRAWWRFQALRFFGANALTREKPVLWAPRPPALPANSSTPGSEICDQVRTPEAETRAGV